MPSLAASTLAVMPSGTPSTWRCHCSSQYSLKGFCTRAREPQGCGSDHPKVPTRHGLTLRATLPKEKRGRPSSGMTRCPCSPLEPPATITPSGNLGFPERSLEEPPLEPGLNPDPQSVPLLKREEGMTGTQALHHDTVVLLLLLLLLLLVLLCVVGVGGGGGGGRGGGGVVVRVLRVLCVLCVFWFASAWAMARVCRSCFSRRSRLRRAEPLPLNIHHVNCSSQARNKTRVLCCCCVLWLLWCVVVCC